MASGLRTDSTGSSYPGSRPQACSRPRSFRVSADGLYSGRDRLRPRDSGHQGLLSKSPLCNGLLLCCNVSSASPIFHRSILSSPRGDSPAPIGPLDLLLQLKTESAIGLIFVAAFISFPFVPATQHPNAALVAFGLLLWIVSSAAATLEDRANQTIKIHLAGPFLQVSSVEVLYSLCVGY